MRLAIICGISHYLNADNLDACANDASSFNKLLDASGDFAEVCQVPQDATGSAAKKLITEFIQKYKGQSVEELLFYFSGHGDRSQNDFFYVLSDYDEAQRESTSLRNTELDSLIRNLSPELTVKIVDACFSGSTYIKSDGDVSSTIEKSAKDNGLNRLYFLHSSSATETSLAGRKLSVFTAAIYRSLAGKSGSVRYRDIMASVADQLSAAGHPAPTFVVQANNLEQFISMTPATELVVSTALEGVPRGPKSNAKVNQLPSSEAQTTSDSSSTSTLLSLAESKALDTFCTEEEASASLKLLDGIADSALWPAVISNLFEFNVIKLGSSEVPNGVAVAQWLDQVKDASLFVKKSYGTDTYTKEEYRELPRKPGRHRSALTSFAQMIGDDREYKLETVEVTRKVVKGFDYTVEPIFEPTILRLHPKQPSLEEYAVTVVCIFSRRTLNLLYSVEHLPRVSWTATKPPAAGAWKHMSAPLKDKKKVKTLVDRVISEAASFVEADATQRLSHE